MAWGRKNEVAAAAKNRAKATKKDAKQRAKGQGVTATNAGRALRDIQAELERNRRNGGRR